MNCVIPYTKEIVFKTKIAEITSISLEHEMNINDAELLGNFIVSGEYKSHELSVNKEEFKHTLPFSIDLSENVDLDSIDFSITDFSYEVIKENTLKVLIEFSVVASEKEIVEEVKEENIFLDVKTALENEIVLPEVVTPLVEEIRNNDDIMDNVEEKVMETEETEEIVEERMDTKDAETIMDSISSDSDTYALYHIHIVKESETIELISSMYNTNIDLINEYNDLSNISIGDKLIIPEEIDE